MKKQLIVLMICAAAVLSVSCASEDTMSADIYEISEEIDAGIENLAYSEETSDEYMKDFFGFNSQGISTYVAKHCVDIHIDQYGIFELKDASEAEKLADDLKSGFKSMSREWDGRYFSEESEKLKNATAISKGKYVLYTILGEEDTAKAQNIFNASITPEKA